MKNFEPPLIVLSIELSVGLSVARDTVIMQLPSHDVLAESTSWNPMRYSE